MQPRAPIEVGRYILADLLGSGGGAVKDTLPPRASVYCGTEDIDSLRQALQLLILDEGRRRDMSAAARISAAAAAVFPCALNPPS